MRTLVHASVLVAALGGSPRADVGTFGLVELTADDQPPMTTLHVRFTLSNTDVAPETFDASTATVELGAWHAHPTCANADVRTLPYVVIDGGDHAVIDLYFALPARPPDLSHVAVLWGIGPHTERAPLVVDWLEPSSSRQHAGWGREWWCDPQVTPRLPNRVRVTSPASGQWVAKNS